MTLTSSVENLLVHLREGTKTWHQRVEQHPLLRPLMASNLSLQHYARVIAAFTGFYETLERRVAVRSLHTDFRGYRYQPRLPLLLEDRASLPGCAVTPCVTVPDCSSDDELLGVFYVLEGATQGGRVIAPRLQNSLALTESTGARYFNLYRQHTWKKFGAMVEHCQQHYDYHLALEAARATFDDLHSHLKRCSCCSGD